MAHIRRKSHDMGHFNAVTQLSNRRGGVGARRSSECPWPLVNEILSKSLVSGSISLAGTSAVAGLR